jgi:DNA polymerase-3 subunit delta'
LQASDNFINYKIIDSLLAQGVERLPHALLFVGPRGVGKRMLAEKLATLLLCESLGKSSIQVNRPCGECAACRWMKSATHPDFRLVTSDSEKETEEVAEETETKTKTKSNEKAKKPAASSIGIDQIRALEDFVFTGSHRNARRIILITEAEAMTIPAANSLLKILEEPPSSVYFILISNNQKKLLPTLRSRSRVVPFSRPDDQTTARWLEQAGLDAQATRYLDLAGGAPLRVMQWKNDGQLAAIDALIDSLASAPADPLVLATRWEGLLKSKTENSFHMENLVEGVQCWLFDLALEQASGEVRYHCGWPRPKNIAALDPVALLAGWREINTFRRSARHPLNPLLFLESLAIHYLRALRPIHS